MKFTLVLVAVLSCLQGMRAADDYRPGADAVRKKGVPQGEVTQFKWTSEKIYPGTVRDCWLYVPAQFDGKKPACLMVFQDGRGFVSENGHTRSIICGHRQDASHKHRGQWSSLFCGHRVAGARSERPDPNVIAPRAGTPPRRFAAWRLGGIEDKWICQKVFR